MKLDAAAPGHPPPLAAPGRRRRSAPAAHRPAEPNDSALGARSLHASGPHGELRFRLQRHQGGLYVEREEHPRRGRPCVQSFRFSDARDFERWCADDPVRFEYPLLHIDLKRDAAELWQFGGPIAGEH